MEQIEKLKIYIIGQPTFDPVEHFKERLDYDPMGYKDYSSYKDKLEFIQINTEEGYRKLIDGEQISGLVLFYDEIFSLKLFNEKLIAEGKELMVSEVRGMCAKLTREYFPQLFDALIPMIMNKQIYFTAWTDVLPEATQLITNRLEEILHENGIQTQTEEESNLGMNGFYAWKGTSNLNLWPINMAKENANYMLGRVIMHIIEKIFRGEIEIKKPEQPTVKSKGTYGFKAFV